MHRRLDSWSLWSVVLLLTTTCHFIGLARADCSEVPGSACTKHNHNCSTCLSNPNCVYCNDFEQCLDLSQRNFCPCQVWMDQSKMCTEDVCAALSCSDCSQRSYCVWCDKAKYCIGGGLFGPFSNSSFDCSDWRWSHCGGVTGSLLIRIIGSLFGFAAVIVVFIVYIYKHTKLKQMKETQANQDSPSNGESPSVKTVPIPRRNSFDLSTRFHGVVSEGDIAWFSRQIKENENYSGGIGVSAARFGSINGKGGLDVQKAPSRAFTASGPGSAKTGRPAARSVNNGKSLYMGSEGRTYGKPSLEPILSCSAPTTTEDTPLLNGAEYQD